METPPNQLKPSLNVKFPAGTDHTLESSEIAGYRSLMERDYAQARSYFVFAVTHDPFSAYRISDACMQVGARGIAQQLINNLFFQMSLKPNLGTPEEKFRCALDTLVLPATGLVSSQILELESEKKRSLRKNSSVLQGLRDDKRGVIDKILAFLENSIQFAPSKTLRLLIMFCDLGLVTQERHRNKIKNCLSLRKESVLVSDTACHDDDYSHLYSTLLSILDSMYIVQPAACDCLTNDQISHPPTPIGQRDFLSKALNAPSRVKGIISRFH